MAGIWNSHELKGFAKSEWGSDVGYLVKEFEKQLEIQKDRRTIGLAGQKPPASSNGQLLARIFGKRHSPR